MKIVIENKPTKHGVDLFWNVITAFLTSVLLILSAVWTSKENGKYETFPWRMFTDFRIATLTFVALLVLLLVIKILFVTIKGFKPNAVMIIRLIVQILALLQLVMVLVPLSSDSWNWDYSRTGLGYTSLIYIAIVFALSIVSLALTVKMPKDVK